MFPVCCCETRSDDYYCNSTAAGTADGAGDELDSDFRDSFGFQSSSKHFVSFMLL